MPDTPDAPDADTDATAAGDDAAGEPVVVNLSNDPDADPSELGGDETADDADPIDRIKDPGLREAAKEARRREQAQADDAGGTGTDTATGTGAGTAADGSDDIPKREYVRYAREVGMDPAEAKEALARMSDTERAAAYEAAGLDLIDGTAVPDATAEAEEPAMDEIELAGDPEDPEEFFADFADQHGFDPRERDSPAGDADPDMAAGGDGPTAPAGDDPLTETDTMSESEPETETAESTATDETAAEARAADNAGQAMAAAAADDTAATEGVATDSATETETETQVTTDEPTDIGSDEEAYAQAAQDQLADGTPMQAPSMDPEEYENQEWTLGEDTGDKEINYKGTRFLLSEPENEAEMTLMEVLNNQTATPEQRYRTVLQTIIKAPEITTARYEAMKGSERMALVGACLEYWGIDDFVDFREQ